MQESFVPHDAHFRKIVDFVHEFKNDVQGTLRVMDQVQFFFFASLCDVQISDRDDRRSDIITYKMLQ